MYFDFEDYRPEAPRIPQAISIREAVLVSVILHLLGLVAYLVMPRQWFDRPETQLAEVIPQTPDERQPMRFVEVVPFVDRSAPPERPADASDMDRRSATRERPPDATNSQPFLQGSTPELIQGGPPTPPAPPSPPPAPPAPPAAQVEAPPAKPAEQGFIPVPQEAARERPAQTTNLRESLSNLQQYLRQENLDNARGGQTDVSADIQFDSKGVEFGPWLLRFKRQVERNWLVPQVLATHRRYEQVVVRFIVHRNGFISNVEVLRTASIPALTTAVVNSLRLSNPTAVLPPEYPEDQMPIVATFHYNYDSRPDRP